MYSYNPYYANYLAHFGIKHKSGRYPWGSGERPNQHDAKKLKKLENKLNKYNDYYEVTNQKGSYASEKERNRYLQKRNDTYNKILDKYPGIRIETIKTPLKVALAPHNYEAGAYNIENGKKYRIDTTPGYYDEVNKIIEETKNTSEKYKKEVNDIFSNDSNYKKSPYSDNEYYTNVNTKLAKEVTVNVDPYNLAAFDTPENFKKNVDKITKNIDGINEKCVEEITKDFYDNKTFYDSWNSEGKYANYTRDQFKTLMQKTLNSVEVMPKNTTMWYMDGNKNPMDMFGDHSITIEFDTKNGKIKRNSVGLQG